MDTTIGGRWSDCPVCGGRGYEWVDAGDEFPVKGFCYPCRGLGFGAWVELEEPVGVGLAEDVGVDEAVAAHWDRAA